jgi:hypothetical protein
MGTKVLWVLGLSCLAGWLYRRGGTDKGTLWRDIGVSLAFVGLVVALGGISTLKEALSLIPCFFASWGALSSYRYFVPKPKDYDWHFYSFHGFMVALAAIPYSWVSGKWLGFWLRCIICAVGCGVWHIIAWRSDVWNERGRGFILAISLPILLI